MLFKMNADKAVTISTIVLVIAALVFTAMPLKAEAAASPVNTLEEGATYTSTLSGKTKHKIRFTNERIADAPPEATGKFTIYIDGKAKLVFDGSDATSGQVTIFKVNSKTKLLFVSITSENDYPIADKIYRYSGGKLAEVGDLDKLTKTNYTAASLQSNQLKVGKEKSSKKGARLQAWTRFPRIKSAGSNKFTVNWCSIENSVGMFYVNIPYTYKDNKVKKTKKTAFAITFDSPWNKNWGTVSKNIQMFTKPGGDTENILAKKTAKLKVTKISLLNGKRYLKAEVRTGQSGWFNATKGEFKEAQFAG